MHGSYTITAEQQSAFITFGYHTITNSSMKIAMIEKLRYTNMGANEQLSITAYISQ